jgi:hypothetical protein
MPNVLEPTIFSGLIASAAENLLVLSKISLVTLEPDWGLGSCCFIIHLSFVCLLCPLRTILLIVSESDALLDNVEQACDVSAYLGSGMGSIPISFHQKMSLVE